MTMDIHEIKVTQTRGHWEVYINGDFYCSADTYNEAMDEVLNNYNLD